MPSSVHRLFLIVTLAALTGCGQMGPLYLPTEEPAANEAEGPLLTPRPTESAESADPTEDER